MKNFPYDLVYSPTYVENKLFEIRDNDDYIILHTAILEDIDIFITGDKDFNDPAKLKEVNGKVEAAFKENYTNKELNIIHTMLGNNPQNRFDTNKKLYEKFGINAKFEKYNGDHNTVTMMRDEKGNFVVTNKIEGFVKNVLNKEKEQKNTKQNKNNFNQRTDKEKNIAKMIRQKNTKIRNDKKAKLKNPPMVRKPAPKKTQSSSTTKKGYTNTILLLLIVAFASGALFMALYTALKNGLII